MLAGIFSLQDALHLLAVRGRLMQALPAGSMLAVALPEKELTPLLGDQMGLAAVNGPRSCVVSGPTEAAAAFRERLAAQDIACRELKTSHAFHSVMMDPILAEFEDEVRKVKRNAPKIPIVSSLHGRLATDAEWVDPAYWSGQLRRAVRFADALGKLLSEQNLIFLEVGPGQTLSALARQHSAWQQTQVMIHSLSRKDETDGVALLAATGQLWLTGVEIKWSALLHDAAPRRVALPTYPFERRRFWIEPQRAGATAVAAPPAQVFPAETDKVAGTPPTAVSASDVEALIGEQLRIMTKQIEILRQAPTGSHANGKGQS